MIVNRCFLRCLMCIKISINFTAFTGLVLKKRHLFSSFIIIWLCFIGIYSACGVREPFGAGERVLRFCTSVSGKAGGQARR